MIIGKQDIKEYFRKQGKKFFAIYRKGTVETGNPICKNEDKEETDPETALRDFEDWLTLLKTGDYTLIVNNVAKVSERGGNRIDFRITLDESMNNGARDIVQPIAAISGPSYSVEEMLTKAKAMAADEFERLMAKKDAEDMKAKNIELEKELKEVRGKIDDPINKFIGALAPHAEPIIAGILGTSAPIRPLAVAGISNAKPDMHLVENSTDEEVDQHAQKVFEDYALALQTARPNDWLEILVKLTTIVKENPKKFEMALTFL